MILFFIKKLTQKENQVIKTLLRDGYSKLDLTLIFKIITRYRNLFVYDRTRGRHSRPNPDEVTIDDDVQRLRLTRNHFLHQVDTELSEADCNEFFTEVLAISERVDQCLNCPEEDSFRLKVEKIKMQTFITSQQLKAQYDEERCLEDFFVAEIGKHEFRVYTAKSFKLFVKELRENWKNHSHESSPTITLTIPLQGLTQIASELREEINKNLINIKIIDCSDGSLVMDIVVKTSVLLNDKDLESELMMLFTLIFTMSKDETWNKFPTVPVIMSESLYCLGDDQSEDMGDETPVYSKGSLKLNLEVDKNILQSDELLKSEMKTLFDTIVSTSTEKIVFPSDKPVVSVIEPCFRDGSHGSMYSYLSRTDSDKVLEDHNRDVPFKVGSINLQLLNKSKVQFGETRPRCCALPNGLLVITNDDDSSLLIMQTDGSIQSKIKLPFNKDDMAFTDITAMNGSCIAVSTLNLQEILVIDVTKGDVVYGFKTKYMPISITFKDRYCLYCAPGKGIIKLDTEDHFKYSEEQQYLRVHGTFTYPPVDEHIVHHDGNTYMNSKIASSIDRICYSDDYYMVTVLDSKYDVMYKCEELNRPPTGITIDHYGVVYIIIERNISVIIHDGKTVRNILGKDDGLIRPSCVHYDRYTQQLIITDDDSVLRYSINTS